MVQALPECSCLGELEGEHDLIGMWFKSDVYTLSCREHGSAHTSSTRIKLDYREKRLYANDYRKIWL